MPGSPPSLATVLRRYLLNPASLGYLSLVLAVWTWIALDSLLVERADASLAGMWGFLVAAPTSVMFVSASGPLLWAGLAGAAIFQALLFGIAYCGLPFEAQRGARVSDS